VGGTRDLQGAFEAFKFSDTSVVRFQVNVQFCVDDCNPVNCADGIQSYGRRRRRDIVTRGPALLNVTDNVTLPPYGTTVPEPYASRSAILFDIYVFNEKSVSVADKNDYNE
jgi:hypothetical protein